MNIIGDLDFTSRYCKVGIDQHSLCAGAWIGLGFEVNCKCICHRKDYEKNEQVERGEPPISTYRESPGDIVYDYE
jgi:hypothetical protein